MLRLTTAIALTTLAGQACRPGSAPVASPVAGKVAETKVASRVLGQVRDLIVHLPNGYDTAQRYPVLYVLDGSSQDQPLADKLDSLSRVGVVPPTIVVGIPNMSGENRTLQLVPPYMHTDPEKPDSPLGTADQFMKFMEQELIPFIASRYAASDIRLFAGNSRGGLLVMYSLTWNPALFAGRLAFSVPLWRENNLIVNQVATSLAGVEEMKSFLYLSAGEKETDNIRSGLDTMAAVLRSHAPSGLVWFAEKTPGVDHQLNAMVSGWSALTKWGSYLRAAAGQGKP